MSHLRRPIIHNTCIKFHNIDKRLLCGDVMRNPKEQLVNLKNVWERYYNNTDRPFMILQYYHFVRFGAFSNVGFVLLSKPAALEI